MATKSTGLAFLLSVAFPALAAAQSGGFTLLHQFGAPPARPAGGLLQASDRFLYGTTVDGGVNGLGTVFRLDLAGNLTTLHSFAPGEGSQPQTGLVQAGDGNFYGTTFGGGASGYGTVFRIDPAGRFTTIYSFSGPDGEGPSAIIQAADGDLYGTTLPGGGPQGFGTVFKMDLSGGLTTLHAFTPAGDGVIAPLVQASDGNFYAAGYLGGTPNPGAIVRMDASGNMTTIHVFGGSEGANPLSSLVAGDDGFLYGSTATGGAAGKGTLYRVDLSGALTVLHDFGPGEGSPPASALLQAADGSLYGASFGDGPDSNDGTLFRWDSSGGFAILSTFPLAGPGLPNSGLIQATDGRFYGTTAGRIGSVFGADPAGNITTLHRFTAADGSAPEAALVEGPEGTFYGTTSAGGANDSGTVFRMDPAGGIRTIHDFSGSDGGNPAAALIRGADGEFYGTTSRGGAGEAGTAFRLDPSGALTVLHAFTSHEGLLPGGLVQASDGNFYGTTQFGDSGGGTVFRMDPAGNLTTLHQFRINPATDEPWLPVAPLVEGPDGRLYGSTENGGEKGRGTVFAIDLAGNLTVLHSFSSDDGSAPTGALVLGRDGVFYGTTSGGGAYGRGLGGYGTVFRIEPGGKLTTLHSFTGAGPDGAYPLSGLVEAADGGFFGTTSGAGTGLNRHGTVFRLDAFGNVTTIHGFDASDGDNPVAPVILSGDGKIYGTTRGGGSEGGGTIFRLAVPAAGGCAPDSNTLCLDGGRFQVQAQWTDASNDTGLAGVVPGVVSGDSGVMWFFSPDNWELLVKVLDGCGVNGHHWVFGAAATDVEYAIQVIDTQSGDVRTYTNPLGAASPAITDSEAFETCP